MWINSSNTESIYRILHIECWSIAASYKCHNYTWLAVTAAQRELKTSSLQNTTRASLVNRFTLDLNDSGSGLWILLCGSCLFQPSLQEAQESSAMLTPNQSVSCHFIVVVGLAHFLSPCLSPCSPRIVSISSCMKAQGTLLPCKGHLSPLGQ